jgi:glycosyltransferase involved in cell wall biosynthesis
LSHTFIRREIEALEQCGVRVERFSIRFSREELPDESDRLEQARTRAILKEGPAVILAMGLAAAVRNPRTFTHALGLALRSGWRSDRGLFRNLAYLAEACVLLRWIRRQGIQHVHAHFGTNPAAVAMLCRALGGPPYSFTAHGPDDFDRAPFLALDQKIARAAFVVTVSSFGRGQLQRWCDSSQWTKIHVLHPGLDLGFFEHPRVPVPTAPTFACVGRLDEQKGQMLLIEAVGRLVSEGVPCDAVIVGDGPMRSALAAHIERLKLKDRITLTGSVTSGELVRRIQDSRALAVPSLAENLPSVILEAFALGRPVIATKVGGISELVETGKCGWLVPAGSVDALADSMREALQASTATLDRMGLEGARRVAENYRAARAAARLARLFETTGDC